MSEFITNDIVRVGNGKVEYLVIADSDADVTRVQSLNTGKESKVKSARLVLVREGRGATASVEALEAVLNVQDTPPVEIVAHDIAVSSTGEALTLIVDGHAVRSKGSFETLAFQLSRLKGTYRVASIAQHGVAKVTRSAA